MKRPYWLPDYDEIIRSKRRYAESFAVQFKNNDHISARPLAEKYQTGTWIIQNPPQPPLETQELDDIYELPFENEEHPSYKAQGGIPAFREVKFSIVSSRGCFGGCGFCAITYHQGRQVRGRSRDSILREAAGLTEKKDFKGYIHVLAAPLQTHGSCMLQTDVEGRMYRQRLYVPGRMPGYQGRPQQIL